MRKTVAQCRVSSLADIGDTVTGSALIVLGIILASGVIRGALTVDPPSAIWAFVAIAVANVYAGGRLIRFALKRVAPKVKPNA